MAIKSIAVADVCVKSRTRKDMGDIEALAMSMSEVGLLHPIVVDSEYRLVAGERRWRAAKKLKWDTIAANIVRSLDDAVLALAAERDENTCRKEFTPSEAVAIGGKLEKLEKQSAKERQGNRVDIAEKELGGNLPRSSEKSRDKVGEAVGMSGRTYEKAKAVVESGDEELIAEMDETGKVDPAYKQLPHVANNSGNDEWYTPVFYLDAAREVLGTIDVDPASCEAAQVFVKAEQYFTADEDGLAHEWHGNIWMNPPYSTGLVSQFIDAFMEEWESEHIKEAIVLVNNATETVWAQNAMASAIAVCFPKGRIKFCDATGKPANSPLQGQVFCYYGTNAAKFLDVFGAFGVCMEVWQS